MQCPHCAADVPDDNAFCELCGKQVAETLNPQESQAQRCTCGAPIDQADEEGFCMSCGRRVRPRETDHMEAVLSEHFAAVSDKGKRHDRNEDRFAIRKVGARFALAVCDGVSTSCTSELASCLAADEIVKGLVAGAALDEAFSAAANAIRELTPAARSNAPSTTAVAALVEDGIISVAWAGDSRAYWVDGSGIVQLTTDHSWLNDVVASGEMTSSAALRDARAHAITKWLGADAHDQRPCDTHAFDPPDEGWLLLCSDGLWNYAPQPDDMRQLMAGTSGTALERCRSLVEFAMEKGGHDNISAVLLRIVTGAGDGAENQD